MSKTIAAIAVALCLAVIAFLFRPTIEGIFLPCRQIFEQKRQSLSVSLSHIEGSLSIEEDEIRNLTERSEMMAMALKTCCVANEHGNLNGDEYSQCQRNVQDYQVTLEQAAARLAEAQAAAKRGQQTVSDSKVVQARTLVAATAAQAVKTQAFVDAHLPKPPPPPRPLNPNKPRSPGSGSPLGWKSPHPADYDDNFHFARPVDPSVPIEGAIERRGDRDFYVFSTDEAKGTLTVRFRQTGPTQINPHLELIHGTNFLETWQAQPGTDLTKEYRLSGKNPLTYLGVWDEGDDASAEVPYRIELSFEGEGELRPVDASSLPLRIPLSEVSRAEVEPNDDAFRANPLAPGQYIAGVIEPKGDRDFYRIDTRSVKKGRLRATLRQLDATPVKPSLVFYDGDRAERWHYTHQVAGADLSGTQTIDPRFESYFLSVSDASGNAATDVPYVLRVDLVDE